MGSELTVTKALSVSEQVVEVPMVTVTVYVVFTVGETVGFATFEVKPAGFELQAYIAPIGPVGIPPI